MRLIFTLLILISQTALAGCPDLYPLGKPVQIDNGIELCNSFYVVEYDEKLNAPMISAEKFRSGDSPERVESFRQDKRLPAETRARVRDYANTGFDKGHLTPADDALNDGEMRDTFLLSNMTPQAKLLNEVPWRMLETRVREMEPDYILTGAIYADNPEMLGERQIPIPLGYYKLVWKNCVISAWFAENNQTASVLETNVDVIELLSGLRFPRCEGF